MFKIKSESASVETPKPEEAHRFIRMYDGVSFESGREEYFQWLNDRIGPQMRLGREITPGPSTENPVRLRRFLKEPYGIIIKDWDAEWTWEWQSGGVSCTQNSCPGRAFELKGVTYPEKEPYDRTDDNLRLLEECNLGDVLELNEMKHPIEAWIPCRVKEDAPLPEWMQGEEAVYVYPNSD